MSQYRQSPFSNLTPVVKNLLIINILVWLATLALDYTGKFDMYKWFALYYFDSPKAHPWEIITYMFMHAGIDHPEHILFNMFALFSFGPILEYSLGPKRFFNFYFLCGIGAALFQMGVQAFEVHSITGHFTVPPDASFGPIALRKLEGIYFGPTVGASGAIFGLLIAFGMLYPNMQLMILFIPIPVKAKYVIPAYIAPEIYLGISQHSGDDVAHFAHIGGALIGFILIKLWRLQRPNNFF